MKNKDNFLILSEENKNILFSKNVDNNEKFENAFLNSFDDIRQPDPSLFRVSKAAFDKSEFIFLFINSNGGITFCSSQFIRVDDDCKKKYKIFTKNLIDILLFLTFSVTMIASLIYLSIKLFVISMMIMIVSCATKLICSYLKKIKFDKINF